MNDIPSSSKLFKYVLYADDTTLFSTIEYAIPMSNAASTQSINNELDKVSEWLITNRLSLNVSKTKYILFHPRQKDISNIIPELFINGDKIERVETFKFLGVIIDSNLSWKYHIEMLSNKISKYCGILAKLKHYLPSFILRTLYYSMINSQLNYGLLVWGYDSNRIFKLQKRSIRLVTRSRYNAHTQPLMKQLKILSLPDMLLLKSMKFYYKYKHEEVPKYFISFNLTTQGANHDHDTRNRDNIRTNRTRLCLTDKCLRNYLPCKINSIPNNVLARIDTHSINGFASAVKSHLLIAYFAECTDDSCYVCHHQHNA